MAVILRIPVEWTGATGLPGVSMMHGLGSSTTAVANILTFFTAIRDYLPSAVTITVPSSGDNIDDGNGQLIGGWSGASGGTTTGTSSLLYAASVGVSVQWDTAGIRNGRRVKGRTFLCPLSSIAYAPDGTMDATALTTIRTAANALASAGNLVVFSRPTSVSAADGESNVVTGATVDDRVSSLRSRRY